MGKLVLTTMTVIALAATGSAAEVRLRSSAACSAPIVRLADIAEVFGDDSRLTTALADVPVCPVPAAGGHRLLSQHDVRQLLALSGADTKTLHVTGSETVTVMGHAASSSGQQKRPLIAAGVRQAAFETELDESQKPSSRAIARPSSETSSDDKEPPAPPLVDRGSAVTVHARAAGVRITTSGKALEAGSAGQMVSVELADNKQRVLAVVTGPQVVEVSVGASATSAAMAPSRSGPSTTANP